MSASADIHATLASILERFAKCALLEMSRAVEQEMTRRKMEVETLMLKLQFTESELRSARKNQSNLRSVGTQVNTSGQREVNLNCVKIHENHDGESQTDVSPAQNEDGIKPIQIKEEHMEEQWDSGPISPALSPLGPEVEDQDSFGTGTTGPARVGSDFMLTSKTKPGGAWSSAVSQEYPAGALSLDASPLETGERFVTGVSPNRRHVDEPYRTAAANHALPSASDHRGDTNAERSSRCPQCGKTFTTRFYLKIHQRIHTGERPYTCPQCGKGFYCNSHLISHQRSHTGEKPYSCEECGKSYSHLNSLKLHQRSHSEEEAYAYW